MCPRCSHTFRFEDRVCAEIFSETKTPSAWNFSAIGPQMWLLGERQTSKCDFLGTEKHDFGSRADKLAQEWTSSRKKRDDDSSSRAFDSVKLGASPRGRVVEQKASQNMVLISYAKLAKFHLKRTPVWSGTIGAQGSGSCSSFSNIIDHGPGDPEDRQFRCRWRVPRGACELIS